MEFRGIVAAIWVDLGRCHLINKSVFITIITQRKVYFQRILSNYFLTHWGRVTHICVSKLTIIGSYNDLSPRRRQAIIWTNGGILLIRKLGTNSNEILSEIYTFSFKKIHLKMSSGWWRSFCLGLNVLRILSADGLASIDVRMFASSVMTDSVPVIMTFDILVGIRNHSPSKIWNEIIYPYPGFNRSIIQVGDGYIISSNTLVWIYLYMLSL